MVGAPRRERARDEGFTLVEVLAAMVVLIVVSTATFVILNQSLRTIRENTDRVQAANIARSQADALRALGATEIPIGLTYGGPVGTDARFTVATTSNWIGLGQQQSSCEAAEPGQAYVRVHVEVTSADLAAPQVIDTVVAPNGTTTVSGTGSVAIAVVDQAGLPVSDVIVQAADSVHPANSFEYVTGTDGCIFVPNREPSASLRVTVARPGFVAPTTTGTTQTLAISAGSVTRSSFEYASAASIVFGSADADFPLPNAMPVTWQLNSVGATPSNSTAGSTITGLWPATTGFTAWAGRCTDSDPQAYSATRPAFAFVPGQATLAAFDVQRVKIRGLPASEEVRAVYAGPDPACSGLEFPVGNSNDVGILRISMPWGTWRFQAGGVTETSAAFTPVAGGATADVVTVAFTLASLDSPSPTPSTSGTAGTAPPADPGTTPAPSGSAG